MTSPFLAPPFIYTVIDTAKEALDKAYGNRKNGELARNALHDECIVIDNILRKSAIYVSGIALGVKDTINKGGFDATTNDIIHDTEVPAGGTTVEIDVKPGGYLNLTAPTISGANSYVFIIFRGVSFNLPLTAEAITVPKTSISDVMIVEGAGKTKKLTGFTKNEVVNVQVCGKNTIGYGALGPIVETAIL